MSFEASLIRGRGALHELVRDAVRGVGAGEERAVALSSARRRFGLDPQGAEGGIRRVQVVHLEGNVLDARLVGSEPLRSLLRIEDLDKLDLGATAIEEHRAQRVPFDAISLGQSERVAKRRRCAIEILDDHPDVIDSLEHHPDNHPLSSL